MLGEVFVSAIVRRETNQRLRQTQARLDLAASSAGAGLWELDVRSGRIWATDQARALYGVVPDEEAPFDLDSAACARRGGRWTLQG